MAKYLDCYDTKRGYDRFYGFPVTTFEIPDDTKYSDKEISTVVENLSEIFYRVETVVNTEACSPGSLEDQIEYMPELLVKKTLFHKYIYRLHKFFEKYKIKIRYNCFQWKKKSGKPIRKNKAGSGMFYTHPVHENSGKEDSDGSD